MQLIGLNYIRFNADEFIYLCLTTMDGVGFAELTDNDVEESIRSLFFDEDDPNLMSNYRGYVPMEEDKFIITTLFLHVRSRVMSELKMMQQPDYLDIENVYVEKATVTIIYEAERGLYL